MAYDRALAQRLRRLLKTEPSITERELFGGLGFFVRGNMACGVIERRLIVRVGRRPMRSACEHRARRCSTTAAGRCGAG